MTIIHFVSGCSATETTAIYWHFNWFTAHTHTHTRRCTPAKMKRSALLQCNEFFLLLFTFCHILFAWLEIVATWKCNDKVNRILKPSWLRPFLFFSVWLGTKRTTRLRNVCIQRKVYLQLKLFFFRFLFAHFLPVSVLLSRTWISCSKTHLEKRSSCQAFVRANNAFWMT